ncbi:mucin-associated surface protein [Trypanosoma cruzi cruzi]|uniref:Mucin-associated surface protein (MASP) n=1 Tax=Trypanosoma cruzi TaxID=5693 RepID=A0A2V2W2Z4_TRYCR|nr:mucin-associated surface protein [Trypanosoma cruzi cruzi]PWV01004.1 Mucin-associated surface protein (MASP) [Trypanosoma cruzi]
MAMMMTGRVLLVCALCVLWCGTPGGRCQEGVDPSGFSPAGPTGDATGNDLLVEEAEGPRREEVGKPKDELGEGTVLNSGITTVEVSETATPDKKTVPAPGPKQEPPPPEKEKVVPTGPSSSGTEPASSKPVSAAGKSQGILPVDQNTEGGKRNSDAVAPKEGTTGQSEVASETSNKNGVETRQSQPMVTVSGDGNKQIDEKSLNSAGLRDTTVSHEQSQPHNINDFSKNNKESQTVTAALSKKSLSQKRLQSSKDALETMESDEDTRKKVSDPATDTKQKSTTEGQEEKIPSLPAYDDAATNNVEKFIEESLNGSSAYHPTLPQGEQQSERAHGSKKEKTSATVTDNKTDATNTQNSDSSTAAAAAVQPEDGMESNPAKNDLSPPSTEDAAQLSTAPDAEGASNSEENTNSQSGGNPNVTIATATQRNVTTTPGDSDGSTAVLHTTSPLLLLLLVVACVAAAAVVAA